MPLVNIAMYPGRDLEKKREIVKEVTATLSRVMNIAPETVWVILDEVPRDNWAAAGVLASDR